MILNIAISIFLGLMVYIWATIQGFFASVIHLGIVIVAAVLAVAIWEPITVNFLLDPLGSYSWTIGLLVPFVGLIAALRGLFSQLIDEQVRMPSLFDNIGGGSCGLLSGVVVAGITVIGLGFLPLPPGAFGVQRYQLDDQGRLAAGPDSLWIPADTITAGLLERLSDGSMASATPLRFYQPALAQQATLVRIKATPDSNRFLLPNMVSVIRSIETTLPLPDAPDPLVQLFDQDTTDQNYKLVVLPTVFRFLQPAWDSDSTLRLSPAQVKLITRAQDPDRGHIFLPVGVGKPAVDEDEIGKGRTFVPFDAAGARLAVKIREPELSFAFVVPLDHDVKYLVVRNLRFEVPGQPLILPADEILEILGQLPVSASEKAAEKAEQISRSDPFAPPADPDTISAMATNALPKPISSAEAGPMEFRQGLMFRGEQTFSGPEPQPLQRVTHLHLPSDRKMVRVLVPWRAAASMLGQARQSAMMFSPLLLELRGQPPAEPVGYALVHGDGSLTVQLDLDQPMRAARDLPLTQLSDNQFLYVYYLVPPSAQVTALTLGQRTLAQLNLQLTDENTHQNGEPRTPSP